MKEIMQGLAAYNAKANERLVGILKGLDEGLLREDQGAYYKSILGTLEHVLGGELNWLKKFAGFFAYPSLSGSALVATDLAATKERAAKSPQELFTILAEADALFVAFAGEVLDSQLKVRVKYKNYKGEELERAYWNTIMHILNHATHHRGEISALLDRKGVANDYSGYNLYTS